MKINMSTKGEGPDIILIHGWGGSSLSLRALADFLIKANYKVTLIDLPGFGQSPAPAEPLNMDSYSELIKNVILDLKLNKPVLVGHSFGGKIALFMAAKYPFLLSKIVLINSSGVKPVYGFKHKLLYRLAKIGSLLTWLPPLIFVRSPLRWLFYKFVVGEQDYVKAKTLKTTFKIVINEHVNDFLNRVKNETLIIWGAEDTITPLWQGRFLAKKIKRARLEVVEGIGHNLPLMFPQLVCELIIKFLN